MAYRYLIVCRKELLHIADFLCCTRDGISVSNWNKVKKLPDTHPEKLKEWRRFEDEYWKKLCSIGVDHIISCLSEGDVLLCWCNKEEWCHRTILAKWLRLNGVEVEEI